MPQVLKEEVRARIHEAALAVFAERGFEGATVAAIGERAGMAGANVYRYYPGKDMLFEAVVPRALAARHEALLEASARAAGWVATGAPPDDGGAGEELLAFWIAHRLEVVIMLEHAAGTPLEGHGDRFVERLVDVAVASIRAASPGARLSREARGVLVGVFEATRGAIARILREHASERAIRESIAAFRAYQIAGLAGFARWVAAPPAAR